MKKLIRMAGQQQQQYGRLGDPDDLL